MARRCQWLGDRRGGGGGGGVGKGRAVAHLSLFLFFTDNLISAIARRVAVEESEQDNYTAVLS